MLQAAITLKPSNYRKISLAISKSKSDQDAITPQRSSRFDYDGDLRSEKSTGSVTSSGSAIIAASRPKEVPREEPNKKELLASLERLTSSVQWFVFTQK